MPNNTGTLSERISVMLETADQLRAEIKKLCREVNRRDGIESIEYLADVPGELGNAESLADQLCDYLESAETCAKMGGE